MASNDLLNQAEKLLYQDIEKESEVSQMSFGCEKYEKLFEMFSKALENSIDENEKIRAKNGLDICNEMLTPIIPVQYMAPLEIFDSPITAISDIGLYSESSESSNHKPSKPPWEVLRERRQHDKECMKYTGNMFSNAQEEAKKEADEVINQALIKSSKEDHLSIYQESLFKLLELQEKWHNNWKGHGPEFIDETLSILLHELNLEEEQQTAKTHTISQLHKHPSSEVYDQLIADYKANWYLFHEELYSIQ